jgi:hypothetical protein
MTMDAGRAGGIVMTRTPTRKSALIRFAIAVAVAMGAVFLSVSSGQSTAPLTQAPAPTQTPASPSAPMPPETTAPGQQPTDTPLTKSERKAQRKQEKAHDKYVKANAKAAKTQAKEEQNTQPAPPPLQ